MAMECNEKKCWKCKYYEANVNIDMYWCDKDHTSNMFAEECPDYDDEWLNNVKSTTYSNDTSIEPYNCPHNMAQYRVNRARKKKKSHRGIKHGRN